jgi:hypothetical protein
MTGQVYELRVRMLKQICSVIKRDKQHKAKDEYRVLRCAQNDKRFLLTSICESALVPAEGFEVGEELGEADCCGFSSVDLGLAFRSQGGDRKRHGDAMVGA